MADSKLDAAPAVTNDVSNRTENGSTSDEQSVGGAGADGEPDSNVTPLDMDDVFHILQNERRRNVLRYLKDADDVVEMRDMAVQIAAWENDTTVQKLHSDQRQRVYIALYQSHLPKLDKLGVIEYNKPRGYVEKRPRLDDVLVYLDPEPIPESPTDESLDSSANGSVAFLSVTGVASILVAAGWLGMSPILASGIGLATVILLLYATTTAYAFRSEISPDSAVEN